MAKRALILVRVSSDGQRDNYSPESQQEACRQYADDLGMDVQKVHTEVASGVWEFDERPVLGVVLDAIRRRQTDAVVIHRINRATRAGGIHALMLAHECERNGVELHLVDGAVKGRVDITNTASKIMLLIAGDQAYEERKSLLEAMARGRKTRVANYGRPLHGRVVKFGYTWVDEHDPVTGKLVRKARAEVCEPEAVIIRRIFADYARGLPLRAIARALCDEGVPNTVGEAKWSHGTLRKILIEPRYGGGTVYAYAVRNVPVPGAPGKKRQVKTSDSERIALPEGTFPPIVDPAIWHAAQARLEKQRQQAKRNNPHPERAILRTLVSCPDCGNRMNVRNLASGDAVYFCKPEVWNRDKCGHPVITASRLDTGVWELLMRVLKNPDVLIQQLERCAGKDDEGLRADVDAYERTLNDIKNREKALIRLAATLSDSEQLGEIQAQLAQLSTQRQSAQSAANQARRRLANQQHVLDQLVETVHRFQALSHRVEEIAWEEKRKIIQAFVVGVLVWPKGSTPRWHADLRIPEFLSNGDEIEEALLDGAIEKPSVRR